MRNWGGFEYDLLKLSQQNKKKVKKKKRTLEKAIKKVETQAAKRQKVIKCTTLPQNQLSVGCFLGLCRTVCISRTDQYVLKSHECREAFHGVTASQKPKKYELCELFRYSKAFKLDSNVQYDNIYLFLNLFVWFCGQSPSCIPQQR